MASHPRDGSPKEPLTKPAPEPAEKKHPVEFVQFDGLVPIPDSTAQMTQITAGVRRLVDGKDWVCPSIWFHPETREIRIGAYRYPLEHVRAYKIAPMAITKSPPKMDLDKYTIGKRNS